MTDLNAPVPSKPVIPAPGTPHPPYFSWITFAGGLINAAFTGLVLNIVSGLISMGLIGMGVPDSELPDIVGSLPGLGLIGAGMLLHRQSRVFGLGILISGCVVALIGGACGTSMRGPGQGN